MYTMGLMKQIQSVYMLLLVAWYVLWYKNTIFKKWKV
jgi:hypothetical protein